jgi:hypothetical protein
MGKWYADAQGNQEGSEILAMGLEEIYTNPYYVATQDPDFFDFIVEVVRRRRRTK